MQNVETCEKWCSIRLNKYGNLFNPVKCTILDKQIVCLLRRSIIWYQCFTVTDNGQTEANTELLTSDLHCVQGKMERITPHLRKTSRIHTRVRVRAMERRARARGAQGSAVRPFLLLNLDRRARAGQKFHFWTMPTSPPPQYDGPTCLKQTHGRK